MAHTRKHVERQYVEETSYTLTLTPDEAEAVAAVLAKIAGGPNTPVRKLTQPVLDSLSRAGVEWFGRPLIQSVSGNLNADG
jgi:hypothetical protein